MNLMVIWDFSLHLDNVVLRYVVKIKGSMINERIVGWYDSWLFLYGRGLSNETYILQIAIIHKFISDLQKCGLIRVRLALIPLNSPTLARHDISSHIVILEITKVLDWMDTDTGHHSWIDTVGKRKNSWKGGLERFN